MSDPSTVRLNSSLRSAPPEVTLERARGVANRLGITRVTDITRLDSIGIPVYSSVRPSAIRGSLCVNAGKGIRPVEAMVGAYMEAIEFACAEPRSSSPEIALATAEDVLDGYDRPDAILDFCPIVGKSIDVSAPLACVAAEDLIAGETCIIPAEIVFLPYVGVPGTGWFGSNSNGLSSGNSVSEATLHGLLEVIERDVRTFNTVRDSAMRIDESTLPETARCQLDQIRAAGLKVFVRYLRNEFRIPVFETFIWDPFGRDPAYLNGGFGCHLIAEIALNRAITEAVQSRLSWIHGARDDLEDARHRMHKTAHQALATELAVRFRTAESAGTPVAYDALDHDAQGVASIDVALETTMQRLVDRGVRSVCRVDLSHLSAPLSVVRIAVPRLEYLTSASRRGGPRLEQFVRCANA